MLRIFYRFALRIMRTLLEKKPGAPGVLLLDLHTMYGNYSAGFDWRRLTSDGCHPNAEGHKWLAGLVTEKIKEQL